jgi:hypothetical protein
MMYPAIGGTPVQVESTGSNQHSRPGAGTG